MNLKSIFQASQNQTKNLRQIKINFKGYILKDSNTVNQMEVIQIQNESQCQQVNIIQKQTHKMDEQFKDNSIKIKHKFQGQGQGLDGLQQVNEIMIIDQSEQNQIKQKRKKDKFWMNIQTINENNMNNKIFDNNFKKQEQTNKIRLNVSSEQKQLKQHSQKPKQMSNQTKIDYEIIDLSEQQKKQCDLNNKIKVNFDQMDSQQSSQSEYFPPSDESLQNITYFNCIKRRLRARDLKQISLEEFYGVRIKKQFKKEQGVQKNQKLQNRMIAKQQHKIQTESSSIKRSKKLHRFRNIKRIHKGQKINPNKQGLKTQKLKQKLNTIFQRRKLQETQINSRINSQNQQQQSFNTNNNNAYTKNDLMQRLKTTSSSSTSTSFIQSFSNNKIHVQNKKDRLISSGQCQGQDIQKKLYIQKEEKVISKQNIKISSNLKNKVLETIASNFQFKCMARQMLNLEETKQKNNKINRRRSRKSNQNQYNLDSEDEDYCEILLNNQNSINNDSNNKNVNNSNMIITIDDQEMQNQGYDQNQDDIIFQQPNNNNKIRYLLNRKIQVSQSQN